MEEYSVQHEDIYGYKVVAPITAITYLTSGHFSKVMDIDPLSKDWNEDNIFSALTEEELSAQRRRDEEDYRQQQARLDGGERMANQTCSQKMGAFIIALFRRQ